LIIGSQAAHGSITKDFPALNLSIETDIAILGDTDGKMADLIDGSIGEASMFQETFGYYAQGVEPQTAILPEGWKQRLVAFSSPETNGVIAQCLELHDLWVSKAMAGRAKDRKYCEELLKRKYVKPETLHERLRMLKGQTTEKIALAQAWVENSK
jgi:hypothetical protein